MDKPHLYSSNGDSWQPHPTLPGIKVQSLENRATWSEASVTIVEVAPAGVIVEHLHETNFESAYVLAGNGLLHLPDGDVRIGPGDGVTIPPQTLHGLENVGSEPMRLIAVHIPPLM
jgi:mannose-6-phosphate isomerase-like protein (cupin superfamily)